MNSTICPNCSHQFKPVPVPILKNCVQCSGVYKVYRMSQKYCSKKCHRKATRRTEKHRNRVHENYLKKKMRPEFVEKYRLQSRIYWAKARSDNPGYIIKHYLRSRIRRLIKSKGIVMSDFVGCSALELRHYLESKFKKGMRWENYGDEWVVDHIHPLSSFDLTDNKQIRRACHFTNLQPLWKEDNQSKAARITVPQMSLTI